MANCRKNSLFSKLISSPEQVHGFSPAEHYKYDSCQEPEEPTSVCFNCGWLKKQHKKNKRK